MSENVLKLEGVLLDKLPNNFSFEGTLDLTGSSINELPEGLFVSENLYLNEKITKIPKDTIIGKNLITKLPFDLLEIDPTVIIADKIFANNHQHIFISSKDNYLLLDDGGIFWYKSKKYYDHKAFRNHDYDRTPFNLYEGYLKNSYAVDWKTKKGRFTKKCLNKQDAKFLVNYQDAIERGLEKYRGLDIDVPMLGHDILEIYQVCTHSCMPVIQEYLNRFNFSLDKYYTLREIGYTIQQFKIERYAPASDVFMFFFNIPNIKEEAN